jgi:hypothetical protein
MRVRVRIAENLVVAQSDDPQDTSVLVFNEGEDREKQVRLSRDERDALVRTLLGVSWAPQFGIMHPSERMLQLNHSDEETWGYDDGHGRLVLFPSQAEAEAHREIRVKKWPSSDWPNTHVVEYVPAVKLNSRTRVVETAKRKKAS